MSQMYHQGSTLGRFAEGHAEVVSMGSQSCLRGNKLKKRILKSIVVLNVVAMLMLATAATTFAIGPPGGGTPADDTPAGKEGGTPAHATSCANQQNALANVVGNPQGAPAQGIVAEFAAMLATECA